MYGDLEQLQGGRWRLRFTRTLPNPPERVWRTITEPSDLAHWFPTTIEGDRAAGAALRFSFPEGQAPPFDGQMLAFVAPSLLELRWGPDILRLELRAVPAGTELTLFDILEELGKAARDAAGWHTCLDALEASGRGEQAARTEMDRWSEVHRHYLERFGPAASTIGPPEGFDRAPAEA